jgi:hypothetical protein
LGGCVVTSPITALPEMPYKKVGPKKKPVPGMKEMAVKEAGARSSAQRAAAGKRATRGKENVPPMMAAAASMASSGMSRLTNHLLLTALAGDTAEASQDSASVTTDMVATSPASEEAQDSEVSILRGE